MKRIWDWWNDWRAAIVKDLESFPPGSRKTRHNKKFSSLFTWRGEVMRILFCLFSCHPKKRMINVIYLYRIQYYSCRAVLINLVWFSLLSNRAGIVNCRSIWHSFFHWTVVYIIQYILKKYLGKDWNIIVKRHA